LIWFLLIDNDSSDGPKSVALSLQILIQLTQSTSYVKMLEICVGFSSIAD